MFDRLYKYALIYGMTPEHFWFGDPQDYFVFQDAFAETEKKKWEEIDMTAWTFGLYEMLAYRQVQSEVWGKRKQEIFPKEPNGVKARKEEQNKKLAHGHPLLAKYLDMRGRGKI